MEPVEPRMEIRFICLRVIFYRGFGDYANFGFRECVVEEVKVKRFKTEGQRVGGEHRDTNGARFTAEMQRKVGEILRCAQDDDARRLTRWIIAGGRLAIGRGSRRLGWLGSGCLYDRACRRGRGAGRRSL